MQPNATIMKKQVLFYLLLCTPFLGITQTWQNIGPDGGFFKDFAIHPTNSDIIYAGSDDGGGVWKTIDGGNTWELLTGDYPNFTGWHIEMDDEHPDTLYFCELYGRYGILKTTDGGETFTHQTDGFVHDKDFQTTQLTIYPGSGDTLFASTGEGDNYGRIGNGVFHSYNGGTNWNYGGLQNHSIHCIEVADAGRVLAGSDEDGLWYLDVIGGTWEQHPDIPDSATVLQIDKKDGVIAVSAAANGTFVSYDNGITFNFIGIFGEFNFDLDIISASPHLEIIATGFFQPNLYTSETGMWTPITDPLLEDYIVIGFGSAEDLIYAGIFSSTQIVVSEDGGATWERLEKNPIATEIRAIAVDPMSDRIYASLQHSYNLSGDRYNTEALARSSDGGSTWMRTGPLAHGMDLVMHPTETETLFLGTFAQGLFKSTDGFDSWEVSHSGNKLILDVVIDPDNTDEMLLAELDITLIEPGIYRSIDGGDSWYNTGTIAATQIAYNTDNDEVYFSTENGIYVSADNGETIGAAPTFFDGQVVLSVLYESPFIYAGTEEGILYKIDAFGSVEEISGDWNSESPTEVRNLAFIDNSLIVGLNGAEQDTLHNLNGGVWQSIDEGETWTEVTADLTNTNVFGNTGIAMTNDRQLLIGTYGQGIFKSDGLVLTLPESGAGIIEMALFPNPAVNEVTLKSDENKRIEFIRIQNIEGQMVYENNAVNDTEVQLNTSNLSKGIYLVQFQVGGELGMVRLVVR